MIPGGPYRGPAVRNRSVTIRRAGLLVSSWARRLVGGNRCRHPDLIVARQPRVICLEDWIVRLASSNCETCCMKDGSTITLDDQTGQVTKRLRNGTMHVESFADQIIAFSTPVSR